MVDDWGVGYAGAMQKEQDGTPAKTGKKIPKKQITEFQGVVWRYYREHGRDLPWRIPESDGSYDPYKVMVSEFMLQQTQVGRVIPKYQEFLKTFPTIEVLAGADLAEVIRLWSGLGYNRRAKYLHEAARKLVSKEQPWKQEELTALKGIGTNTANAIAVYAYNLPLTFIETNIRTVFIHCFFTENESVDDKEIIELVKSTLPEEEQEQSEERVHSTSEAIRNSADMSRYRQWYWALMDYGTYLKTVHGNASRRSSHYTKQSAFEGSRRQLRGKVLCLLQTRAMDYRSLAADIDDERLDGVLEDLVKESMIQKSNDTYSL